MENRKSISKALLQLATGRPRTVIVCMVTVTLLLGALIPMVQVDTDPENMLSEDEAVRVFHNAVKHEFSLNDIVVLGIVNEEHPDGVFNVQTLGRVHALTDYAMHLSDPDNPDRRVVSRDVIAPGNVDTIEQAGQGQVRFQWLMKTPPETREKALSVRDSAMGNPLLKGTMVSEDGRALAIYLPITTKDFAYTLREKLLERISKFKPSGDQFHITGLPVAEDTFGVEMFVQMALSAPLAMVAIFLLMLFFFRKMTLIVSPMIVAMVSVISTMGLLIGTGNTLHIMSSMIPIFLMPIAVVDSIHILSEFSDTYHRSADRTEAIGHVMHELFMPMLYTSLTSAAGFASLALTPIPPVQVFGIFVACGILLAWCVTILFIPAYISLMSEDKLAGLGQSGSGGKPGMQRVLAWMGNVSYIRHKLIISLVLAALVVAVYGITRIQINDNPVKWFKESHDIRIADRVLNRHFGGTYEAYLVLEGAAGKGSVSDIAERLLSGIADLRDELHMHKAYNQAAALLQEERDRSAEPDHFIAGLMASWDEKLDAADDSAYDFWADALDRLEEERNSGQIFKRPETLRYLSALQAHLGQSGHVGKSNSVADLVKKIYQELYEGDQEYYRIPDSIPAVAQTLISFQNSHKPDDLWHLVTPDYRKANIWVQLKSGDNRDMEQVVAWVNAYVENNPPPVAMSVQWAGLTYLNIVWQDKMVWGMLKSFLSSFVVVFIMMSFLFRSFVWGSLAMIPLTVTIACIYGIIGLAGKDYDMPVAVLSALTLGLAVDFAIHFLERSRVAYAREASWSKAAAIMFDEPARAITRNVIVIAVGFTPLLAAPLVPYNTVGIFLASIMAVSGLATMFILPALITVMEKTLFNKLE